MSPQLTLCVHQKSTRASHTMTHTQQQNSHHTATSEFTETNGERTTTKDKNSTSTSNLQQLTVLLLLKPVLGDWQSSYRRCRKDEVVLCHARIGHTHLTHSYILRKDPPPQCEHCQCILTVRHILVECNHFAQERKDIFGKRDVVESFRFGFNLPFV